MGVIVCAGQAIVDCIFSGVDREKGVAESISVCPGGEAFNEAVTLSALGAKAVLCCGLGDDLAGRLLLREAEKTGVIVQHAVVRKGAASPTSGLFVDGSGERRSVMSRANAVPFYEPALPECGEKILAATMGSLFRPPFLDPENARRFALQAKAAGALLLADTKMPRGADPSLDQFLDVLPLVDILTPNETEAAYYTGCSRPEDAARAFRELGVSTVIVKLGPKGCYVLPENGDSFFVPAIPTEVADGIGAGDAFAAGLLLRLTEEAPLREACRFATACASLTMANRGAVGGVRSREAVEACLEAHRSILQ